MQTETITATLNGIVTLTTSVTFTVGPASSTTSTLKATPASAVANGTAAITATLKLKDAQGHPIPGVTPSFAASGTSTTMSAVNATNASGVSAVTYKTTLAQNENAQVSAASLSFVLPMVFVAGPPAPANSSLTISPSSVVADGNTPATLSVHLADQYNNRIKTLGIGFQATGGAGPFSLSSVVTDASGNATNAIVSPTQGSSKVIAYAAGVALTTTLTSTAPTPYCTGNPNYLLGRRGTNTSPWGIKTGDWNGDGRPDFAYADNNNQLVVYTDSGGFGFVAGQTYTVCAGNKTLLNADMDGDGYLDLVLVCFGDSNAQILYGTGAATFPRLTSYYTNGYNTIGLALGDFSGDGRIDLAASIYYGNQISVFTNSGSRTMSFAATVGVGNGPRYIASGDFNGDGLADLAAANSGDNTVSVVLATGSDNFATQIAYAVRSNPYAVGIGEFDNNNKLDLAVVNQGSNTVSVLLGSGNGSFGAQTHYATGSAPENLGVADFNGDGYTDLLICNTGSNTVSILKNAGNGTFLSQVPHYVGVSPKAVATGFFSHSSNVQLSFVVALSGENYYGNNLYTGCN